MNDYFFLAVKYFWGVGKGKHKIVTAEFVWERAVDQISAFNRIHANMRGDNQISNVQFCVLAFEYEASFKKEYSWTKIPEASPAIWLAEAETYHGKIRLK